MKKFVILLGVLGLISTCSAEMLADFETGVDGFSTHQAPLSTLAVSTTPTVAVTSGSQCLKVTHAPNFWPIRWTPATVPTKMGKLSLDLTMLASEWPSGTWTRFCQKVSVVSSVNGWWESPDTTTANWIDRNTGAPTDVDWGTWAGDCVRTFTIDLSNYPHLTGATSFWIVFSMNAGAAGPYYIDNVHWVDEPSEPSPANGGVGIIGSDTTLSWKNSTDSMEEVNAWFGVAPEPNLADPNTILSRDTYQTILTKIYTEANPGATSSCPMPALTDGVVYTWCVAGEPNEFPIPFWTFTATTNSPPVANAGADQYIYEYADLNNIVITLTGAGSDDGHVSPLTYQWTQTAGPSATIASQTASTTSVTLTGGLASDTEANASAPYVFELVADDGQFTDADDVTVFVNSNSCTASIEAGGFYYYGDIAGPDGSGDEFRDCKVDLYDFAEMAVNWLGCTDTFEGC